MPAASHVYSRNDVLKNSTPTESYLPFTRIISIHIQILWICFCNFELLILGVPFGFDFMDVHNKKTRSFNISRIKGKNTKPEMLVRSGCQRHHMFIAEMMC
jgi:hypothetical protein